MAWGPRLPAAGFAEGVLLPQVANPSDANDIDSLYHLGYINATDWVKAGCVMPAGTRAALPTGGAEGMEGVDQRGGEAGMWQGHGVQQVHIRAPGS